MAKLDPFSQQIVEMVRNMSDEAILELVRNQLGMFEGSGSVVAASATVASARSTQKRSNKAAGKRRTTRKKGGSRASSAQRAELLTSVERVIKGAKGLSASEIAKKTKLPQSRVASLVRELKKAKRIHQGGDRRFARYAGDAKTAQKASITARKNAAGPRRR
jgi:Replication protein A C terminal